MELVNVATGKTEALDDQATASALAAGTHQPVGSKALINPDGELVFTPMKNVELNLARYGYSVPTQDQLTELANQKLYGEGLGNEVRAGLEGAARGATFGGSDYLAGALGADPEAMRQRRELNPTASTVGEIGGALGSALLAPEVAPAGLVSKLGTSVAARLAPEALTEGATLASRVLGAAGQVGAQAAGSAVEGAAYGLGQTVTEAALGDPDLNAEKVMANIGYGGLFGGALGGALKAGEIAVPAAIGKAQETIQNTYRKLIGGIDETGEFAAGPGSKAFAKAASFATGEPEQEILDHARKVMSGEAEVLTEAQRRDFYRDFNSALDEHYKAVNKASQEASTSIRPQETAALLADADPAQAVQALEKTRMDLRQTIAEMQAAPELYPARFPTKLQQIADGLDEKTRLPAVEAARQYTTGNRARAMDKVLPDITAADAFKAIEDARKALDDKIPWNKEISGEAADAIASLKELRGKLKGALEDESVWGEAGARTSAYNNSVSDFLTSKKEFQKAFMKKVPTRSGGVTYRMDPTKSNSFFNMINDPRGEIKADALKEFFRSSRQMVDQVDKTYQSAPFDNFERESLDTLIGKNEGMAQRAQKVIASQPNRGFGFVTDIAGAAMTAMGSPLGAAAMAARAILDPKTAVNRLSNIERAAQKVSQTISTESKAVFQPASSTARRLIGPVSGQLSGAAQEKDYGKRVEALEKQNASPAATADHLDWATRDMYHVAPNISSSMQMTALRGSTFLQAKIPRPPAPTLPFDKPFKPTLPQIVKFNRYYDTVNKPLAAIDQLRDGFIHPETVEALQTVYPQLYSEMRTHVMDAVTTSMAKGEDVPYQKRMAVSAFLQAPLDSSMLGSVYAANQAAFAQIGAKKAAQESSTNVGSNTLSDRLKTSTQDTSQREAT